MGILALLWSGTTAKERWPLSTATCLRQIRLTLVYYASFYERSASSSWQLSLPRKVASDTFMGTKGLLTAFIAAFVTVNVYKVCVWKIMSPFVACQKFHKYHKYLNDSIYLSQSFCSTVLELLVKASHRVTVAIHRNTSRLFSAADGYLGITYLWCLCFLLVCGNSRSAYRWACHCCHYMPVLVAQQLCQAGQHADKIITSGTQMFIVTMGGTGAFCSIPLYVDL